MKILKSWIQDHIVEKLPSDDIITSAFILKSSEVEGIEKTKDINGNDDTIFDIKVLPDRAHYMLSHRGVAYDLATILGLTLKSSPLVESAPNKTNSLDIKINSNLCRRYNATLIENISITSSPLWLKYRLEAIEARSINSIVDATNYAMFDSGQPLHAFDADKVVGSITVRFANTGEKITIFHYDFFTI
jgi:phenylalanyl-tRNA synthetase beta chain